jgi:8-oxo-dGTP pyrophosphatase MutT (NUDIX family)
MGKIIHKAAGILIKDKRILVTRSGDTDVFVAPGGKLEQGEPAHVALIRELKEELGITVTDDALKHFGVFRAEAAGQKDVTVVMDVFMVREWTGTMAPHNEVVEIAWADSTTTHAMGSIFAHEVIPRLFAQRLII